MKQFYLLCCLFLSFSLNAQITITSADVKAEGATAFQTAVDSPDSSIDPGGTGQLNWDFSALTDDGSLEFVFTDPSTTPFFSDFPTSNLASVQGDNYFYFIQTDSELSATGTNGEFLYQGFAVKAEVYSDPPQTLIQFPATNGDSFSENITQTAQAEGSAIGLPVDSARIVRQVNRTVTIDAYGSITTPLGTFECIRSTEHEVINDELFTLTGGVWSSFQTFPESEQTLYNWWTKDGNFGFPVVQVQTDEAGTVTGANWVTDFVSDAEERFDLSFALYPNPASTELSVEFPELFSGSVEIVNMNGQVVWRQNVLNTKETFSISEVNPGPYALIVRDEKGGLEAAKRFEVVR